MASKIGENKPRVQVHYESCLRSTWAFLVCYRRTRKNEIPTKMLANKIFKKHQKYVQGRFDLKIGFLFKF